MQYYNKVKISWKILGDIMWKNRYFFVFSLLLIVSCKYNDTNIPVNNDLINNKYIKNNICEIHNKIMDKRNVEIHYGILPMPNEKLTEYKKSRLKYFPNSDDAVNGGCIVTDTHYVKKYICSECNKVRDKYKNILRSN